MRDYKQLSSQPVPAAGEFVMMPGRGVVAVVSDKRVLAGSRTLLDDHRITLPEQAFIKTDEYLRQGCTVIYVAVNNIFAGFLALSDTLRAESAEMIGRLAKIHIQPVLLTGDHKNAAGAIAGQLHITEVYSECMPEDKLRWIDECQRQKHAVCMIGDGINDASALKKAHVGIAMGGVGSDIAVDAADIVLVDDEIRELIHLFALSRRMMRTIKCNIAFSLGLNFLAIALAFTGALNPVMGALVHNAGSVMVIINSAWLLTWRKKYDF